MVLVQTPGMAAEGKGASGRKFLIRQGKSQVEPSAVRRSDFPCFLCRDPEAAAERAKLSPHRLLEKARVLATETKPRSTAGSRPFRVAFIRVDFQTDRGGALTSTPDGKFDLRTGITAAVDPPPHNRAFYESHGEALRRFYEAQSGQFLDIEPQVFPADSASAFHMTDLMDYGPWAVAADNVDVAAEAERFIGDALNLAAASGEVDFNAFDAFIVVHAGADLQSDINRDSPRDIPTFVLEFGDSLEVGGRKIGRAMVLPETTTQDGLNGALNGVLAHEFGHILGLFDLYNVRSGLPMVGYWSLMDSGENIGAILVDPADSSEVEVVGAVPSSFDPWSRLFLYAAGYFNLNLREASPRFPVSLPAVELGGGLVFVEIHDTEYYLIENRCVDLDLNGFPIIRQDRNTGVILGPEADSTIASADGAFEYDALLPGGGLLVWHIDDRVVSGDLADPLGLNTFIGRRGIRLIEADGIEDLGRRNNGTPWDPFYASNNGRLSSFTVPASRSNDGDFSRITIETPCEPGPTMGFAVRRDMALTGWPVALADGFDVEHVTTLDVTGDGSPELLFTFGQNIVALEGRGAVPFPVPPPDAPPGTAVPFLRHNSDLAPRFAAGPGFFKLPGGGGDPLIAAQARNQGRVVTWNARTGEASTVFNLAVTSPAIRGELMAFGDVTGRVHLVSAEPGGAAAEVGVSPENTGADDAASGNVLIGSLTGSGIQVAWSTASGRVRVAGFTSPGSPMVALGSTPGPAGAAPLSLVAAPFRGAGDPALDIAAVDREGVVTLVDATAELRPGWPVTLAAPMVGFPAAGDVDGDGSAELVIADTLGTLNVLNGDGAAAVGFPIALGSRPVSGPMLIELDGEPGAEILLATEDGGLRGINRRGEPVRGFPLAVGGRRIKGPVLTDMDRDGRMDVASGSDRSLLIVTSLADSIPDSLVVWAGEDGGPGRNAVLEKRPASAGPGPEDRAGIICFPNPARGDRMHVRLQLETGQTARADVYDLTGRPLIQGLRPRGGDGSGEADIQWDLSGVSPGVYMVRVEIQGPGAKGPSWRTVSVLR